jgi:hypothetical protein
MEEDSKESSTAQSTTTDHACRVKPFLCESKPPSMRIYGEKVRQCTGHRRVGYDDLL